MYWRGVQIKRDILRAYVVVDIIDGDEDLGGGRLRREMAVSVRLTGKLNVAWWHPAFSFYFPI